MTSDTFMGTVWLMLHGEMEAIQGEVPLRMGMMMREMEDMVVENKLKRELGPMRGAWDAAVGAGRGRARAMSL